MKSYFLLQYKMANRKLGEWGIHPFLAYLLAALVFTLLSVYLFYKTEFAGYVVLLSAVSLLFKASETTREEFLLLIFGKRYRRVRIIENLIISFPFLVLLLCYQAFAEAGMLLAAGVLLSFFSFKTRVSYSLPTPFFKKPFEFATGFRKTFILLPVVYFLTVMAIWADNLNLGIFSLLLTFLMSFSYYLKPENEYFVWSYAKTPARFLLGKIKTASVYIIYLALPVIVALVVVYPEQVLQVLLFTLIGYAFLVTVILAKYSAYPGEISLPEGVLFSLAIYFPPFILVLMPVFYSRSVKKLSVLLK